MNNHKYILEHIQTHTKAYTNTQKYTYMILHKFKYTHNLNSHKQIKSKKTNTNTKKEHISLEPYNKKLFTQIYKNTDAHINKHSRSQI